MKVILCRLFHLRHHEVRVYTDGLSFQESTGQCLRCGHHWGEGRLAINIHTGERRMVLPCDIQQPGNDWIWYDQVVNLRKQLYGVEK